MIILTKNGRDAKEKRKQEMQVPPQPPRSKLLLFIFAGLFCSAAGVGLYMFGAHHSGGKNSASSKPPAVIVQPEQESMPADSSEEPKVTTIGQYIDHGDGTVTDTKTGLMWKRCSDGLSGDNCEDGKVVSYKWDDAVQRFKNVEYAGYADWRLPTIDELKTLVHCSKGVKDKDDGECNDESERPTINQQAFPNTWEWYWSGSPDANSTAYAWLVNFGHGYSGLDARGNRSDGNAVRLVRGGSVSRQTVPKLQPLPNAEKMPQQDRAIGQYIYHGDGTVTDTKTGLIWKRCSEGLSGVNCEKGELKYYTWNEAVKHFKNVEYADHTDWRMPTIDELKTLVYCSKGVNKESGWCNDGSEEPTINQQAFPNTKASVVWSGSPYVFNSHLDGAVSVSFGNGVSFIDDRSSNSAVRLVRDGR
ncbi:hypothetical protein GCAAIG_00895 [Candidatus Electronema halotolerans]